MRGARAADAAWALAGLAAGGLAALAHRSVRIQREVDRAFPPGPGRIRVDGVALAIDDRGGGADRPGGGGERPVLLIHGLAGQMRNFTGALSDALARDRRVVAFDRPGSGHSPRLRDRDATLAAQARLACGLIEALGLAPAVLVGHSFGGAVALRAALDRPELVASVALVAPLTAPMALPPAPVLLYAIPTAPLRSAVAWTLSAPLSIGLARWRARRLFGPDPVHPEFGVRFGGLTTARPTAARGASADLMVGARGGLAALHRRLHAIDRPVGILYGNGDRILDPRRHGEGARDAIPGATLERIEGGHMLPVSAPETVARFVRAVAARAER